MSVNEWTLEKYVTVQLRKAQKQTDKYVVFLHDSVQTWPFERREDEYCIGMVVEPDMPSLYFTNQRLVVHDHVSGVSSLNFSDIMTCRWNTDDTEAVRWLEQKGQEYSKAEQSRLKTSYLSQIIVVDRRGQAFRFASHFRWELMKICQGVLKKCVREHSP